MEVLQNGKWKNEDIVNQQFKNVKILNTGSEKTIVKLHVQKVKNSAKQIKQNNFLSIVK